MIMCISISLSLYIQISRYVPDGAAYVYMYTFIVVMLFFNVMRNAASHDGLLGYGKTQTCQWLWIDATAPYFVTMRM